MITFVWTMLALFSVFSIIHFLEVIRDKTRSGRVVSALYFACTSAVAVWAWFLIRHTPSGLQ